MAEGGSRIDRAFGVFLGGEDYGLCVHSDSCATFNNFTNYTAVPPHLRCARPLTWTTVQVQEVLTAVAAIPSSEACSKKGQLQDFAAFVPFLKKTQWAELERCRQTEQVSVKMLRYLVELGL